MCSYSSPSPISFPLHRSRRPVIWKWDAPPRNFSIRSSCSSPRCSSFSSSCSSSSSPFGLIPLPASRCFCRCLLLPLFYVFHPLPSAHFSFLLPLPLVFVRSSTDEKWKGNPSTNLLPHPQFLRARIVYRLYTISRGQTLLMNIFQAL